MRVHVQVLASVDSFVRARDQSRSTKLCACAFFGLECMLSGASISTSRKVPRKMECCADPLLQARVGHRSCSSRNMEGIRREEIRGREYGVGTGGKVSLSVGDEDWSNWPRIRVGSWRPMGGESTCRSGRSSEFSRAFEICGRTRYIMIHVLNCEIKPTKLHSWHET